MKNIIIIPILLLAASLLSSCEDETENVLPVNFQFRLLDENGNPSTEFDEGENFVFSFLIINNSLNDYFLNYHGFNSKDFFRVHKKIEPSEGSSVIDMGKPYEGLFCEYTTGTFINANDTLKLEIPWRPSSLWRPGSPYFSSNFCFVKDNNINLSKGQYQTSFTSSFTFSIGDQSFTTEEKSFNINFNIK